MFYKSKDRVGLRPEILGLNYPQGGKRLHVGLLGEQVSIDPERLGLAGGLRKINEESQGRFSVQQLFQE